MTIRKIAELAGVSIGTVDRVINNRGKVSPVVEKRIRNIIDEFGYKPNIAAKSLSMKHKLPKVGVLFHMKQSGFYDKVLEGIEKAQSELSDFGVNILIRYAKNFNVNSQLEIIDELIEQGTKALAIDPINDSRIADKLDELIISGFPVYCLVNDIETHHCHPFIGPNAKETGRLAAGLANIVSGNSKQKMAVISPPLKMLSHTQKIEGLKEELTTRYDHIELIGVCEVSNNNIEAYKSVLNYMKKHKDISIIWYAIAINDGGITALEELDFLGKIKVISLDTQDFIRKGFEEGYITATISQQPDKQGYHAIKRIFDNLIKDKYPCDLIDEIPCEIIIRESIFRSGE